jgi:hypothetical protein
LRRVFAKLTSADAAKYPIMSIYATLWALKFPREGGDGIRVILA